MSAQFTPGPWEAQASGVIYDAKRLPLKLGSGWLENAWCDDDQTDETRANARLIAAAPDLLAALKKLSREAEEADPLGYGWREARSEARAALSRALGEGEQS